MIPAAPLVTAGPTTWILASQSRSRKKLLREAGFDFQVVSPRVDEEALKKDFKDLSPPELARALAKAKALSVSRDYSEARVIAADQILFFQGHVLDKPQRAPGAIARLMDLRGKPHTLLTTTVVYERERCLFSTVDTSTLTLDFLSHGQIRDYVEREKPWDSVGAYKIEGSGRELFSNIQGSEDVIMGLNIEAIRKLGDPL